MNNLFQAFWPPLKFIGVAALSFLCAKHFGGILGFLFYAVAAFFALCFLIWAIWAMSECATVFSNRRGNPNWKAEQQDLLAELEEIQQSNALRESSDIEKQRMGWEFDFEAGRYVPPVEVTEEQKAEKKRRKAEKKLRKAEKKLRKLGRNDV